MVKLARLFALPIIVAALSLGNFARASEPLRFAVSTSWGMPFARYEGEQLVDGIMLDLMNEIGRAIPMPVRYVMLPRKRIEAAALAGEIDLRCFTHPTWSAVPDQFAWSSPLFVISEVVFGGESVLVPKRIDDLRTGTAVSTVLGYSYPTLEPYFSSGHLRRDDAVDQERVWLKVAAGRTDYGVTNNLGLDWYRRTSGGPGGPNHAKIAPWHLTVAKNDFYCAVPKVSTVSAEKVLQALEHMKKAGRIEKILLKYR